MSRLARHPTTDGEARRRGSERGGKDPDRDAFDASRQHPMCVIKIRDFVKLESPLPAHEEVAARGLLVEWQLGLGDVMFVSHTWLGERHPDPSGVKFEALKAILSRIIAGTMSVNEWYLQRILWGKMRISASRLSGCLADGFLWLDYVSIPQANHDLQMQAVASIGAFIASSSFFLVLAGTWRHEVAEQGMRDLCGWAGRGWCRFEQLANALSPRPKWQLVATNAGCFTYGACGQAAFNWLSTPVGTGDFSFAGDRAKLGVAIGELVSTRAEYALKCLERERGGERARRRHLLWFRLLTSLRHWLLAGTPGDGGAVGEEPLEAWLDRLRFRTIHEERRSGLTPLRFAALACRGDLVRELVAAGADVEVPLSAAWPEFDFLAGETILHRLCRLRDAPEIVALLIDAGADPLRRDAATGLTPLHLAFAGGHPMLIQYFVSRYGAPAVSITDRLGTTPLCCAALFGRAEVVAEVLRAEARPDELDAPGSFGMPLAFSAVTNVGDVATLRACLDAGCSVDAAVPRRQPRALCAAVLFLCSAWRRTQRFDYFAEIFAEMPGCTCLGCAAMQGNLGATELLLSRGADTNARNAHGRTPLMLAASVGNESIVAALLRGGADPGATDSYGGNAATVAASHGHRALADSLRGQSACVAYVRRHVT
mmetsp:Transcript_115/g.286  ORF Transcript_115/g.286 Transcript_115/m.286 type:complete len:656 (-) Transcript_115:88-2055(-)